MKRRIEKDEDDMEISMKNELICLILIKIALMTLITSFMVKIAVNNLVKAAW